MSAKYLHLHTDTQQYIRKPIPYMTSQSNHTQHSPTSKHAATTEEGTRYVAARVPYLQENTAAVNVVAPLIATLNLACILQRACILSYAFFLHSVATHIINAWMASTHTILKPSYHPSCLHSCCDQLLIVACFF